MTESEVSRVIARRRAVEREILDHAWSVMAREGVAALSVREVARAAGMRQQSLTYYFPTKQALLDALFADGFADLADILDRLPPARDADEGVVAVGEAVVDYCTTHPARYHLMFQRTVPGFAPTDESHQVALRCLGVLASRLHAAGVRKPADVALVRGIISGLAAEQIANDPAGRTFVAQVGRGLRAALAAFRQPMTPQKPRRRATTGSLP
jgi:AcrR family transcriptional regulator